MMNGRGTVAKKPQLVQLPILKGKQAAASAPASQVRLSASAGTGKTQVLTARVLRLLLHDEKPEAILCLTFTKAGAAEMADRIHERLGGWVTMEDKDLRKDLLALGEPHSDNRLTEARNLFAKVLDARGSGLRIQTIHSFCQTLLASFPGEAGLPQGFRLIEGREEEQLAAKALADMVEGFERDGRSKALDRLKSMAKRLSEDATRSFLRHCAGDLEAMEGLGSGEGLEAYVRRALSGGIDDIAGTLLTVCNEGGFDRAALEQLCDMYGGWRKKDGNPYAAGLESGKKVTQWLSASPDERPSLLVELRYAWLKKDGDWRTAEPPDLDYRPLADRLDAWIENLITLQKAATLAPAISDALQIGQDYARAYADAKRAVGAVDFNDLIRRTVALLKTPGIGEWIKFKLDQQIDHVLVDEAQDTNVAQWDIVKALAEEFFAGAGAKPDRVRTLFTVGDFKQAIFGFQGTDPHEFQRAGDHFAKLAEAAEQDMLPLSLSESYRSSQPILDVTDAVLNELGHERLGLPKAPDRHGSALRGSGSVTVWQPISNVESVDEGTDEDDEPENAVTQSELIWARTLAERIKSWMNGGLRLRNQDRDAEPGDVMILVRSRGDLARLIVSQLHKNGVEVAGVDRLRLNAPIAVQDLLACIRFAVQPRDDLSLACLLVSPLVGWSQQQLYDQAFGRKGDLWPHLNATLDAAALAVPRALLAMADRCTPYQFLEAILSEPSIGGRKKLIARLGDEARDPIEELLNAALIFEAQIMPSLQVFLDWFDRGDVDIKRDPAKPENKVRVMTVHGAKGLQAPIVVLADATSDPDYKRKTELKWEAEPGTLVPLFRPKKEELVGSLKTSAEDGDAKDRQEHWRLLYVAMTRAEEHLFIGGALKPKQQGKELSEECWHVRIDRALLTMGAEADDDGARQIALTEKPRGGSETTPTAASWAGPLPTWAAQVAPEESRPPRPLAPSAILPVDEEVSPPPSAERRMAARRGVLLHALFERLPSVSPSARREAADTWLEHSAGVTEMAQRREVIDTALDIMDRPAFAALFTPEALAEAPLAGVVGERLIAGTVDRLLISDREILVVDFKTGRRVPASVESVSLHHKAQMGAYAAVLSGIFPGRTIRAALLYTSGPALIELSASTLEAYKPGFQDDNQLLPING
jgi:ATP-dependent helicase/nuclease subunit A